MKVNRIPLLSLIVVFVLAIPLVALAAPGTGALSATALSTTQAGGEAAAEIAAYDAGSQRIFLLRGDIDAVEVFDVSDPAAPQSVRLIDVSDLGVSPNSVAAHGGLIAVAIEAEGDAENGHVGFYDATGKLLGSVEVGVLPDMLTFAPDGKKVVVANEGEPSSDYTIDPEGTISVIDISGGVEGIAQSAVTSIDFTDFNAGGPREAEAEGIRIFGPGATFAQDVEPEYVAISPDSNWAFATLQENNALAVINLLSLSVDRVVSFGTKNHSLPGNGMDASNEDGGINIQPWPVLGMYQPDAIDAFTAGGAMYLITANEGDARDYDGYSEEARVADLTLDSTAFPNAWLQDDANLGRLTTTTANGDLDGDGDWDVIYGFSSRSFSIWTPGGELVYDSGDQIEQITAEIDPARFNSNGDAETFDDRSDDKGPEVEGVVVGEVEGTPYAFVGMERFGGVLAFDVSDPTAPEYVTFIDNPADVSPEGLLFIDATDSPTGAPLLVTSNEVSGTMTIYSLAVR